MTLLATLKLALRALRRNKLRSCLTMLGIIIGVGAVIAVFGIGNGAKGQVEAQIATLGENMILIFSGNWTSGGVKSGWGGAGTLKIEDAEAIETELSALKAVSPEIRSMTQCIVGSQNWMTQLLGESPDYFDMRQWPLVSGAPFGDQEVKTAAKVVVLGQTTAQQLFGDEDPVGHVIRLRHVPFMVVGLLKPKGLSLMGNDQDDVVIVPYTTAMKRLTGDTKLRSINAQAMDEKSVNRGVQQISALLRQRHHIAVGADDDFTVRSQQEIAEMATQTSKVMTKLLAALALISLLIGGIGIMNIMLVSVTERTREIGIRAAVGAHGADILLQFLMEAVTLSLVGGGLGILLGFGSTWAIQKFLGWPVATSTFAIILAVLVSAVVGIVFGIFPAHKAASLDPIDALRHE
ncbi:MAG TPA: ABC transporter permease [Chthoniobacteraceae bacterium]|jgi:putative ABC transport system permease protein|nr:ABC transporter permease [Chthoniobacteraceae bacterium]